MSVKVMPDGHWEADKSDYGIDVPFGEALARFFIRQECRHLFDIGCGAGGYVEIMRNHGLWCRGYDLNPRLTEFCDGCEILDVTQPMFGMGQVDAVMCLEVGEHVPSSREGFLLDNVCNLSAATAVLSWFPRPGEGIGHINEHPNSWVIDEMKARGFVFDGESTSDLRKAATTAHWFTESLLIFHRA
jgi:Methyltransferase domain